ncbi:MAG: DUF2188 domain-containing protein [Anaerolineae bacterium]|nr:DUF2188 domain-containing protein [Anaerolineae bacterium]
MRTGLDRSEVQMAPHEAIEVARQIALNQGSEVVIHRRDGTIRDMDSYGNDPHPPNETEH